MSRAVAQRTGGGEPRSQRRFDVALDDPSSRTGALQRAQVEAPFRGESAGERRRACPAVTRRRSADRCRAWLSWSGWWFGRRYGCARARLVTAGRGRGRRFALRGGAPGGRWLAVPRVPTPQPLARLRPGRRSRLCRAGHQCVDVLVRRGDDGDDRAHRRGSIFGEQALPQHAVAARDEFHDRLVGLYLGERLAALHRVAFVLEPLDEAAFLHRR